MFLLLKFNKFVNRIDINIKLVVVNAVSWVDDVPTVWELYI